MTAITVNVDEAQLKAISRALSEAQRNRVARRGVNTAGKRARVRTRERMAELFQTSLAATNVKARAARAGQGADPQYKLYVGRSIPIGKLRARARKFRGGRLTIAMPEGRARTFRRAEKLGPRAFGLRKAGPLPARPVGGIGIRRGPFDAYEGLRSTKRRVGRGPDGRYRRGA